MSWHETFGSLEPDPEDDAPVEQPQGWVHVYSADGQIAGNKQGLTALVQAAEQARDAGAGKISCDADFDLIVRREESAPEQGEDAGCLLTTVVGLILFAWLLVLPIAGIVFAIREFG